MAEEGLEVLYSLVVTGCQNPVRTEYKEPQTSDHQRNGLVLPGNKTKIHFILRCPLFFFYTYYLEKNKLQVRKTIIVLKSLACQVAFHPSSSGKTYGIAPSSFWRPVHTNWNVCCSYVQHAHLSRNTALYSAVQVLCGQLVIYLLCLATVQVLCGQLVIYLLCLATFPTIFLPMKLHSFCSWPVNQGRVNPWIKQGLGVLTLRIHSSPIPKILNLHSTKGR